MATTAGKCGILGQAQTYSWRYHDARGGEQVASTPPQHRGILDLTLLGELFVNGGNIVYGVLVLWIHAW